MKKLIRKHKFGDQVTLIEDENGQLRTKDGQLYVQDTSTQQPATVTPQQDPSSVTNEGTNSPNANSDNSQPDAQNPDPNAGQNDQNGSPAGNWFQNFGQNLGYYARDWAKKGAVGGIAGMLFGLGAGAIKDSRARRRQELDELTGYNTGNYSGRGGWFGGRNRGEHRGIFQNGGLGLFRSRQKSGPVSQAANVLASANQAMQQKNGIPMGSANITKDPRTGLPVFNGFNSAPTQLTTDNEYYQGQVEGSYAANPPQIQSEPVVEPQPQVLAPDPIKMDVQSVNNPNNSDSQQRPLIQSFYPIARSGIKIKKKNKGKFTDYCGGEVTDACIKKAKASGNKTLVKRATFAENSRKWKHQFGGLIKDPRMWAIINNNMSRYKNISMMQAIGQEPIYINGDAYYLDGNSQLTPANQVKKKLIGGKLKKKYKQGGVVKYAPGGIFSEYKPILNNQNMIALQTLPEVQLVKYPLYEETPITVEPISSDTVPTIQPVDSTQSSANRNVRFLGKEINLQNAVDIITKNQAITAGSKEFLHTCTRHVANALKGETNPRKAGGIPNPSSMYNQLMKDGWTDVLDDNYVPQIGDVYTVWGAKGGKYGMHTSIFNGKDWLSYNADNHGGKIPWYFKQKGNPGVKMHIMRFNS